MQIDFQPRILVYSSELYIRLLSECAMNKNLLVLSQLFLVLLLVTENAQAAENMESSLWSFEFTTAKSATEMVQDIDDGAWHSIWFIITTLKICLIGALYHMSNDL